MLTQELIQNRFKLIFEPDNYRRLIGNKEVIIHCHHYNVRLQSIVEGSKQINGKEIILSVAEEVFSEYIQDFIHDEDSLEDKWHIAAQLYAHLGYGSLDFAQIEQGIITSTSSHFVEGWKAGFEEVNRPVCTFTEGYLQGVIHGITGESLYVKEEACIKEGAERCRFVLKKARDSEVAVNLKQAKSHIKKNRSNTTESNIDEPKIIQALVDMPIYGNDEGVIPVFNVYLANTPADFYNLLCIRFVEEMKKFNLFNTARNLLLYAGEVCAVNTFRGILISEEWFTLIAPMVKQESDCLFGLIAVSNALGWGNWHILKYEPARLLEIEALNGYEAYGYLEYRGKAVAPQCFMLTGVAAGIMELLHGEGTVEERVGTYYSEEKTCVCCLEESCFIEAEIV